MDQDAQLTANRVVGQLAELGRELDSVVRTLKDVELEAVRKRHGADLAESHAFVQAAGSVDLRRHLARIAVAKQEEEAVVAEAVVRYLRTRLRALDTRIEIGRSMGAALRSELKTLPYDT